MALVVPYDFSGGSGGGSVEQKHWTMQSYSGDYSSCFSLETNVSSVTMNVWQNGAITIISAVIYTSNKAISQSTKLFGLSNLPNDIKDALLTGGGQMDAYDITIRHENGTYKQATGYVYCHNAYESGCWVSVPTGTETSDLMIEGHFIGLNNTFSAQ